MKGIRWLTLLLASVLCFSGCGIVIINREEETTTAVTTPEGTTAPVQTYLPPDYPEVSVTDGEQISADRLAALPSYDFDGRSVYFAVATEVGDVFNDETGIYIDAVTLRNEMLKEKYNATVYMAYQNADLLYQAIGVADKAGEYYADYAVLRASDIGLYHAKGYLRNMTSVNHLDFSQPYYDAAAMEQLMMGGVIFGAVGDATESIENYACLYYNRTLGEAMGLSLDYKAIREGEFTWESLLAQLKMAASAKGGEVFTSSFDATGIVTASFASTGQNYLRIEGVFGHEAGFVTETTETLIGYLKELMPLNASAKASDQEASDVFDLFSSGGALYAMGSLGDMKRLANCGFSWEVLPMPKMNEEDPYTTSVAGDAPVITVLTTSRDIDTIGHILQGLNAASCGYVTQAYYNDVMKNVISGVYTLDMLDLICENPIYDFCLMFGSSSKALREGTYEVLLSAVEGSRTLSYYASRKSAALNWYLDAMKTG